MKRNIFKTSTPVIILLMLLAFVCSGQTNEPREKVAITQSGTVSLVNGIATVALNESTRTALNDKGGKAEYFVTLTSVAVPVLLSVGNKSNEAFVINSEHGQSTTVEYVVYLKKILPVVQMATVPMVSK